MSGEKIEYEYHWGRIFTALAILCCLVAAVLYALIGQPIEEALAPNTTPVPITNSANSASSTVKTEQTTTAIETDVQATHPAPKPNISEVTPQANDEAKAQAEKPIESALEADSKTTDSKLQSITLSQVKVKLISSKIKRFVLAKDIKNKEPVDSVDSSKATLALDAKGIATVYGFSELIGAKDQYLHYQWHYQGKRLGEVEVGVWGARWRSFSSKFITPQMLGDWRLELYLDQELAATAEFVTTLSH